MIDHWVKCSESQLLLVLGDETADHDAIFDHVERCSICQNKLGKLGAEDEFWRRAANGLVDSPIAERQVDRDVDFESASVRRGGEFAVWNEAMAAQLLLPPSHPEMLGSLGRFDIERLIGAGGMGIVFKAFDTELNRPVAIKVLAPYLSSSSTARSRFAREASAAAGVVDDHVVPIYNVDSEGENPFFVMQYVAGGSLQSRLDQKGRLEVVEVLRTGMQVAKGLAAAHKQGVIHRDVKPSNVLLDEEVSRALLSDFGLARTDHDSELTRSGFHPGTPHYMSPEQVRGEQIDGRSDLFSLGCVLYALCTGSPPFRAESSYAVLRSITDNAPVSVRKANKDIPEWLERIVMRLLEKRPEKRYSTSTEVAELLEACLAHVQNPATNQLPEEVIGKRRLARSNFPLRLRTATMKLIAAGFFLALILATVIITIDMKTGQVRVQPDEGEASIEIVPKENGYDIVTGRGVDIVRKKDGTEKRVQLKDDQAILHVRDGGTRLGVDYIINGEPDFDIPDQAPRVKNTIEEAGDFDATASKEVTSPEASAAADTEDVGQVPIAVVLLMHPAELHKGNTIQRQAALQALQQLRDHDYCGYLSFTNRGTDWLWGDDIGVLRVGENRDEMRQLVETSLTGDLPEFDSALKMAYQALMNVDVAERHLIVLTDGDPVLQDAAQLSRYRDGRITISAIHVELHDAKYRETPMQLAKATQGTYYRVRSNAAELQIPRLFRRQVASIIDSLASGDDPTPTWNSLRRIAIAFHEFENRYRKFPGSANTQEGSNGVTGAVEHAFSWRVALLPFLGEQRLYDRYRFEEAWDSPHNRQLIEQMPDIYAARGQHSIPRGQTHFLGFATDDGALGTGDGESLRSFTDGLSRTILVVEGNESVPWTQPVDLRSPNVQPLAGQTIHCIMADGSLEKIGPDQLDQLESMVSRNGREQIKH